MSKRCFLVFALACLSVAPLAVSQNVMSINKVPGQIESKAQRLTHDLQKQGFEVNRGYFKLWGVDQCQYTFDIFGLCFGNNPAAPYITFAVPPWPNEFVYQKISSTLGPSAPGYNDVYRLDPHEAIIVLAQMPPPARFFSEQTWVFTRRGTPDTGSTTYKEIASDPSSSPLLSVFFRGVNGIPDRLLSFSSISNPVNNAVITNGSGAAFDQLRYFIITPDEFMNKAVRKAFSSISVADHDVFTETVPSSEVRIGLDAAADDFLTAFRFAQPNDGGGTGTASAKWREDMPMVVLRVRDTHHEPQPYTAPLVYETRTANSELPLAPDLNTLLNAVARRWGQPCAKADCSDKLTPPSVDFQGYPLHALGTLCRPIGEDCVGDNWDASYEIVGPPKTLDSGEIYAIAAPLGTETDNATYVGLSLNRASMLEGIENLSDKVLTGTASAYSGEVPNAGKFFLYYFTRNCSGLESLTNGNCYQIDPSLIGPGDRLVLVVRDYLRPGTERGPDSSLLLLPKGLLLHRP
jgi:hypothetical protein